MAVTFNGIDRLIEITDSADVSIDVQQDLYSAWKDWSLISDNSKYAPAFRSFGGDPTAAGQSAPKYYFLINYWKVYINNGEVVDVQLNLYSQDFPSPFVIAPGSGVSNRNSDAVNVNEEDIKNQSYLGARVYINTSGLGEAGTEYPIGTPPRPSDNYADAVVIATSRNYTNYHLDGTLVLGISEEIMSTSWLGGTPISSIIVATGQDSDMFSAERLGITGTFSPTATSLRSSFYQCALGNITDFYGIAQQCALNGTLNIYNGSTTDEEIILDNCISAIGGNSKPVVNINGMPSEVQFRHYSGGLKVTNATHIDFKMSIDGQGRLELDSTCTEGEIVVGGDWDIIDNSGPNCNVIISTSEEGWTDIEKKQIRDALGVDGDKAVSRGGQLQEKSEYPYNSTINTNDIHTNDSN